MVNARFGRDPLPITGGLHWRIYPDKPDTTGVFRLLREERAAAPIFVLPPGGYVIHVSFGLATAAKKVQSLFSETVRESFGWWQAAPASRGGSATAAFRGARSRSMCTKAASSRAMTKWPIASGVGTTDVLLLPEGTYHVVSNYGDSNATVRSDIRVQAGKLTDVVVNHRAAVITLKLVNERGGEAQANTQWSVLTPGGDVVKEAIGAFPKVILAEGEYRWSLSTKARPTAENSRWNQASTGKLKCYPASPAAFPGVAAPPLFRSKKSQSGARIVYRRRYPAFQGRFT